MSRYYYAIEKFSRAIHTLATGKEEVRKRLLSAFQDELLMIDLHHLPEECQKDYAWILKTITRFDEKYKGQKAYFSSDDGRFDDLIPGRIECTLHRIRKETGAKIAEKIYSIWYTLTTHYNS